MAWLLRQRVSHQSTPSGHRRGGHDWISSRLPRAPSRSSSGGKLHKSGPGKKRLSHFTWLATMLLLGACAPDLALPASTMASTTPGSTSPPGSAGIPAPFPTEAFAGIRQAALPDALATELDAALIDTAGAAGMTATLMTPEGSWSGATGTADGVRAVSPADQMAIGSITKSLVAAQVMQLVDAGELRLDEPAAGLLPPSLDFDTNGSTIGHLLGMRSGIPDYVDALWASLSTDKLRSWTANEVLALVGPHRTPVGEEHRYSSSDYVLLGLILEQVRGRPLAEVLRDGVLSGDDYQRLIYQPAEPPTEPMALPSGAPADTFEEGGGYLPSLAATTAAGPAGGMASDSATLARWWSQLCGGLIVSDSSLNEMTNFDDGDGYGLGLFDQSEIHGTPAIGNGGIQVGFTAYAACLLEPGSVVVVLSNGTSHDATIKVADALLVAAGSP
ncbi:MAG TPA: serine hydrolase domain-containing protein [Acidimicrobiia bacterium]|nr:serine hydrolase domain-containing protein [Acidimicrobiia bacterium]